MNENGCKFLCQAHIPTKIPSEHEENKIEIEYQEEESENSVEMEMETIDLCGFC